MTTFDTPFALNPANGSMVRQDFDCELFHGNFVEKLTASLLVPGLPQIDFTLDDHSVFTTLGGLQADFQFISPLDTGLSVSHPYGRQYQDACSTRGKNIVRGDVGGDGGGDVGAPQ